MCQCGFIIFNKRTTLAEVLIMVEAVHAMGSWDMWEISASSAQYCYGPKTALKNKVY